MLCFDVYYIMVIVFCQVFVTCFLCDLRHIVLLLVAYGVLGLVGVLGFSRLDGLASCLGRFVGLLGCLYGCGRVRGLWGLLGVWWVSHWCGLDGRGGVCTIGGVR